MAQIDEAITAVMKEVGAIAKERENRQQGFNYRGIEDVYNRLQPLMARHGIFSVPKVLETNREMGKTKSGGTMWYVQLTVEYTFRAADESSVVVVVPGEGMDSGDKASNKAMAAAHKLALCQLFEIPYQVIDPDQFSPDYESSGITQMQYNQLKRDWVSAFGSVFSEDEYAEQFRLWAMQEAGLEEFAVGNYREWTAEHMASCQSSLDASAEAALLETGLTPDAPG